MTRVLTRLRDVAKDIPCVYRTNAAIKSGLTLRWYRALDDYYRRRWDQLGNEPLDTFVSSLLERQLSKRTLNIARRQDRGLRILYVGSDWQQDSSGFLQSLEKLGTVYTFTKAGGEYGHYFLGHGAEAQRQRAENGRRLLEIVRLAEKDGPLDIVIGQMWGRTMPWQTLKTVQDMGIITVNICMDDRHAFKGRSDGGESTGAMGLISGLDLSLTAAPEVVRWYAVEGLPAFYWPEASDPTVFHPMDVPKKHDVCFVGGNYGIRAKIVRALHRRNIEVACYGNGWPNGRIPTEDVPELFASSRMILGVGTIGHCPSFYSLKMRDFDAPMSGSLYLTHDNPDLYALYEVGKEVVVYRTPEECADKVRHYLRCSREAEAVARAGHMRATRDHTWCKRFRNLFDALECEHL